MQIRNHMDVCSAPRGEVLCLVDFLRGPAAWKDSSLAVEQENSSPNVVYGAGGASRSIFHDAENRSNTMTVNDITSTFAYDGDGKWVKKTESNGTVVTTTVYPGIHYELKTYSSSPDLPWWSPRWAQREVLTVTNQMASVLAAGYTLKLYLSGSQASNIYSKSLASGNDLRVVYWDGKAWKELDRDLVSFSSSAIELRPKTQADIAASGQDANYYLYYGNPTAGSPPSEGKKIYSYFNEFSINVLDWTAVSGTWGQAVTTGADGRLTWTYRQSDANNGSGNTCQKTLSLTDFVYEVKAKVATAPSGSHAGIASWRYVDTTHFYAFDYGSNGFTGIWEYDGTWNWLQQTPGISYAANTWYSIAITSTGITQSVKVGSDTWSATDSSRISGTIGLRSYLTDVYYDDVKVRKLVSTEPTIALGAEATRPVGDKYYYAGSQRIGMRSNGALYYIFSDHLGGTSVTLNATTGATSTVSYLPFGGMRQTTGMLQTDRLFTGQRLDGTGLYDYGARQYDPALGRFISPDALIPQPTNPQTFNRYAYAANNPVRYRDPTGHWFESALDIAFLIYDIHQIAKEGWTTANTVALVADAGALLLPGVTGAGPGARLVLAGGGEVVARTAAHVPAEARVMQMAGKSMQTGDPMAGRAERNDSGTAPYADDTIIKAIEPPKDPYGLHKNMERAGIQKPEEMRNAQAHHNLPWKLKDWFASQGRGLNVNDPEFGRWVEGTPPGRHQNWSWEYEQEWRKWIAQHETASRQDVLEFLAELESAGRFPPQ